MQFIIMILVWGVDGRLSIVSRHSSLLNSRSRLRTNIVKSTLRCAFLQLDLRAIKLEADPLSRKFFSWYEDG
jgi:hypothetical protein